MDKNIQESLNKAILQLTKLRKANSRFIVISIIASVLATLLAGFTAFNGKPVVGQGAGAWAWTCGIVAVFTATATVFTGLHKQLTISERMAKATECVGKLRSIQISIENAGTDEPAKKDILNEYRKVVEIYSEFIF